jgi:hypothetical protein
LEVAQEAVALCESLGNRLGPATARVGLARALQALQDRPGARAQVDLVLRHLESSTLDSAYSEPLRDYLLCYEVLRNEGDPRAELLLARAHADLEAKAARLGEAQRCAFLEAVPWNRAIVAAWAAHQQGAQ